jgi:disulfide bond formation protein DsbB
MNFFENSITIMALGTVFMQVFAVVTILMLVIPQLHKQKQVKKYLAFIKDKAFFLAFLSSLSAVLGSLFFSDVASLLPCELCWKQRIFMYPQIFLFGVAVWKKEKVIADYSIVLSIVGLFFSVYHYVLQMLPKDFSTCETSSFLSNCSEKLIFKFGYITIPMMSMTVFSLLLLFMIIHKFYKK